MAKSTNQSTATSTGKADLAGWVDFSEDAPVNLLDPETQLSKIEEVLRRHDGMKPPPKHKYLGKGETS